MVKDSINSSKGRTLKYKPFQFYLLTMFESISFLPNMFLVFIVYTLAPHGSMRCLGLINLLISLPQAYEITFIKGNIIPKSTQR